MKNLIALILFSLLTSQGFSQVQLSCKKSWGLDFFYERDVAYLTFQRLYEIKSVDTNKIIIPQVYQDSIWKGLSAIYNAFSIEQRDSVFDVYCVHNTLQFGSPMYPGIIVELDTTFEWTMHWLNGDLITGYNELYSFLDEYDYSVQSVNVSLNRLVINSDIPLNPFPVKDSLLFFNGVIDAYPEAVASHGDKIEYRISGDEQLFNFTLAWGDCMSGCIYLHTWKFKVNYSSCLVEYLGLESNANEDFPNPTNCNITSVEQFEDENSELLIYPNPTSDFMTIECKNIIQIELWNNQNILMQKLYNNQNLVKLDLRGIASGLYLIKVKTNKAILIRKFIKM